MFVHSLIAHLFILLYLAAIVLNECTEYSIAVVEVKRSVPILVNGIDSILLHLNNNALKR